MAKLQKIKVPEDIHLNINATFDFINQNLPEKYSRQAWNLLPDDAKVDLAYIRTVKKDRIKNALIMNALYRVAQFNKLQSNP